MRSAVIALAILLGLTGFQILAGSSRGSGYEVESLIMELEELKERVRQLEKRLKEQVRIIEEQKKQIAEEREILQDQSQRLIHIDKHIIHAKEILPRVVKNIAIGGGITMIGQGSIGLDDDAADGNISADLEISAEIGRHGEAFLFIEAGAGEGLSDEVVGAFGVNGDAGDNGAFLELTEAWYEHRFSNDRLMVTAGKLDLTNYLDTNEVANDETLQFLAPGFVNNPMVEFPDNALGTRLTCTPSYLFSITFGWQEADGDWEDIFERSFGMGEVALHPVWGELEGNYRFYAWVNAEDHIPWSSRGRGRAEDKKGWGVGMSMDQKIRPWLTFFARCGTTRALVHEPGYPVVQISRG